ncbi:MAG: 23S rRNA (uracil(1939)-C(5))-methyltransferase RlmD, partial [Lachnospiraceae bacterium]|nr:23S rRNA (uracil(1939)-C(5))-methyltransferase RlmD [Lachnospiraceae bacterium]
APYVWEGVQESPVKYEYRNKMEFTFGNAYKDGPLTLGMHKRGSFYDVVSVEDCKIIDADYRLILRTVREYFTEKNTPFFHRMSHEGYLRHLLVRKSRATDEILVGLVTTTQIANDDELIRGYLDALLALEKEGKLLGRYAGILHIYNDSLADVVRSDHTVVLYGQDVFGEKLLNLDFQVSTFSFFQTNSLGAEVIYQTVQRYISEAQESLQKEEKPVVFDLYCGTGTITQLMSPVASKVIGVEIVEEAVEAAKRSAAENHLTNCEFLAGDVLKVIDEVTEKPDLIILDPPREGIHPKALPKILDYGVDYIVYVSCKLTSLLNDLKTFRARGYEVVRATAVDQFPWTTGVETICLIRKR